MRSHISKVLLLGGITTLPSLVYAEATIATYIIAFGTFLNDYVIPFIIAIAVLFLLWGLLKSFIIGGASEESRDEGKKIALWGIVALVLILSLWGITNALVSTFGIGGGAIVCPDYYPDCN